MVQPPQRPSQESDPFMYASMLGAFIHDRNPIQVIAGDIGRMFKVIVNLNKNMKAARIRIEQLEHRVREVEAHMESVNPKTEGRRLNRLR